MQYFFLFLEGIMTFISPCMLPMLPIYITYFTGNNDTPDEKNNRTIINAIGFVLGFTVIFILLGALSGTFGAFVFRYSNIINIIFGIILIIFGLNYIGIFKIGFLNASRKLSFEPKKLNIFRSILFGILFCIGWTPCIGTFLGSALMIAANSKTVLKGILMLFIYSMGLGIPFILSAVLIEKLKKTFDFIKRNYKTINIISGILLIVLGILMMLGFMGF